MKLSAALLSISLVANAVLVAIWVQPSFAPSGLRDYFSGARARANPGETPKATASAKKKAEQLPSPWSAFEKNDLHKLVAQLRAAGFPSYAIRVIVEDRLRDSYAGRIRQLTAPDPNAPYAKMGSGQLSSDRFNEMRRLNDEHEQILHDLLGVFAYRDSGAITNDERRSYGDLSPGKVDAIQRVEQDYEEMKTQARAGMDNITLPEDKERIALLEREEHTDLAALLTPEEMENYDIRHSPVTGRLRQAMTYFHASESEFRAIYQIEAPLEDVIYPSTSGDRSVDDVVAAQRQANAQMSDQLKAALGDERYAEFTRSSDSDYRMLVGFERQQTIPDGAALQVYDLRDHVAQESTRVFNDSSLDNSQKLAALQTLAQSTRAQMLNVLGPAAGETYLRQASFWLAAVERGQAVSFTPTPQGTTSNFRSLPAPPRAGNAPAPAAP